MVKYSLAERELVFIAGCDCDEDYPNDDTGPATVVLRHVEVSGAQLGRRCFIARCAFLCIGSSWYQRDTAASLLHRGTVSRPRFSLVIRSDTSFCKRSVLRRHTTHTPGAASAAGASVVVYGRSASRPKPRACERRA